MTALEDIVKAIRKLETPFDQAHNYVHVAGQVDNNNMMKRNARRMEAQVDALLKAKYKECGMEGAYQPPDEDDDMGNTYINCPIVGNEAVAAIAEASIDDASRPKRPWWTKFLFWMMLLGAVIIGAIIVFLTADFFQGDPARYEAIGLPFNPNM